MLNEAALQIGDKVFINDVLDKCWQPYFGLVMTVTGFSDYGSAYTTFDDKKAFEEAKIKANRTPSLGKKSGEYAFSKCYIDHCPPTAFDLSEMV